MKTLIFSLFVLISFSFSSCTEDNNSSSMKDVVDNTVSAGTWRITYFFDSENDETAHFSGYSFAFGNNNVLTATNGTNTFTGTWILENSSSNDDTLDDIEIIISFTNPPAFEELSEDWHILTRTDIKIELQHVSGGDGSIDYLTFEKN